MPDPTPAEPPLEELADLVHELRQPLSALGLLAENVRELDLPEGAADLVTRMADQAAEAVDIARKINRLLA